jgi:hypothetical protein
MVSRAEHYRRTTKHAQRHGQEKPKMAARDTDTTWIPEFMSSIQGLEGYFNADSIIAVQLDADKNERLRKLRELSSRGLLVMSAHREQGFFVEYRWRLVN